MSSPTITIDLQNPICFDTVSNENGSPTNIDISTYILAVYFVNKTIIFSSSMVFEYTEQGLVIWKCPLGGEKKQIIEKLNSDIVEGILTKILKCFNYESNTKVNTDIAEHFETCCINFIKSNHDKISLYFNSLQRCQKDCCLLYNKVIFDRVLQALEQATPNCRACANSIKNSARLIAGYLQQNHIIF